MSTGLKIRDANGRIIIDPDTFTVRLVTTVNVAAGERSSAYTIAVEGVTSSMFGSFTHTEGFALGELQITYKYAPKMPSVTVGDGVVTFSPPMGRGEISLNGVLYVYANV